MNLPQRALTPVVHAESEDQALRNVGVALDNGAHGVWLISHGHLDAYELLGVVRRARERFAQAWLGVNFLSNDPAWEFGLLGAALREDIQVDGLWTDNPQIRGANPGCDAQDKIAAARKASLWQGAYFGGVAFKYQPQPLDVSAAVVAARPYVDVLVTTGPGTGHAADSQKVRTICQAARSGDKALCKPVALASGVDENNIETYARLGVTRFLVASSLSATDANGKDDFANLDGAKVERMRRLLDQAS